MKSRETQRRRWCSTRCFGLFVLTLRMGKGTVRHHVKRQQSFRISRAGENECCVCLLTICRHRGLSSPMDESESDFEPDPQDEEQPAPKKPRKARSTELELLRRELGWVPGMPGPAGYGQVDWLDSVAGERLLVTFPESDVEYGRG
jgi:hypothetical protein